MLYIFLGVLLGLFIYKLTKPSKYWENRNVLHEPSWPIIGNMSSVVFRKKPAMQLTIDLYRKHSQQRYVGIMQFTRPMLLIRDLELIKQLTIKEFDHFHDHSALAKTESDPLLSKSLVSLTGQDWRQMRATLSPVFTSSKMRIMYQLMAECAENFVGHFRGKEQVAVDMKDIFSRFTTDVIATTAFGIKINSLDEPKNMFFTMGSRLNQGFTQFAKLIIFSKLPFLAELVGAQRFPKEATNFFRTIVKDNIDKRQKNGIVRPDLINLLIEARDGRLKHETDIDKVEGFATAEESHIGQNGKQKDLTDDDIVAQAMLFFFAGLETASTASCFLAYELAVHPDIQEKLQKEVDEVNQQHKGKVSYETLLSMKYLDQVVCESLRLWPPGFQTERACTKDYPIPPQNSHEKEVFIEKGVSILIPVIAIHRDPQYYPNPEKFDPDRFSDENKSKIVPGTYMPFGAGPRNCIGSRFALLEIKTLFFHLLSKFDVVPVRGTQIPLKIAAKNISLTPERGFRMGFKPRKCPP